MPLRGQQQWREAQPLLDGRESPQEKRLGCRRGRRGLVAVPAPVLRTARPPPDVPGFLAGVVEPGPGPLFWRTASQLFGLVRPPPAGFPHVTPQCRVSPCSGRGGGSAPAAQIRRGA